MPQILSTWFVHSPLLWFIKNFDINYMWDAVGWQNVIKGGPRPRAPFTVCFPASHVFFSKGIVCLIFNTERRTKRQHTFVSSNITFGFFVVNNGQMGQFLFSNWYFPHFFPKHWLRVSWWKFAVGEISCEMPVTYIGNWYFTWNFPLHCGRAFISWLSSNVWGKNEGNTSY